MTFTKIDAQTSIRNVRDCSSAVRHQVIGQPGSRATGQPGNRKTDTTINGLT